MILRAVLSHRFNSLMPHFEYFSVVYLKNIFLCVERMSASVLYFPTKVRRLFFAGDGSVVNVCGT